MRTKDFSEEAATDAFPPKLDHVPVGNLQRLPWLKTETFDTLKQGIGGVGFWSSPDP